MIFRAYVRHLRPAVWPILVAHGMAGYVLAVGWHGLLWGDSLGRAALGLALWVVLLTGGTLALDAALDREEAGRPPHLLEFAVGVLVAGLLLSISLTPGYRLAFAFGFLLGVIYALPPVRLRQRPALDRLARGLGFGVLLPYAMLSVTGRSPSVVVWLVLAGFGALYLALYPLTELSRPGSRRALWVGVWACALAFALWLVAWVLRGHPWYVPGGALLGLLSLAIAFATWMSVLLPRLGAHEATAPFPRERGAYHALAAWVVSDVAVVVALGL